MTKSLKTLARSLLFLFFLALPAFPEVVVHDIIATRGEKASLVAETKGKFFSSGGEVVEFFINGKSIGRTLSGGDGFAFKQFIPKRDGIYHLKVKSGKDTDDGLMLSLSRGTGIVVIDVESGLLENPFSMRPKEKGRKSIIRINKRYPVVFLKSGFLNIDILKTWLEKNGFRDIPLIAWERGAVFDDIHEMGLKLKSIIGSPQVIKSAESYHPLAFSFQETENAIAVKDWKEIEKRLK
jgi:hypothetical protein